jgi:hypothetical protein
LKRDEGLFLDEKYKNSITHIIDLVNESLLTVPNKRRKEIKLGDFLVRHPIVGVSDNFSEYANKVIKQKLERVLGNKSEEA